MCEAWQTCTLCASSHLASHAGALACFTGGQPCADRHNLTACLDVDTAKSYARTYTQAVAGHMLSFVFNKTTAQATLQFAVNTNITAPTQLFVAERWHYPQGYTVDISPPSWATWHAPKPNQVLVTLNKATAVDGGTLTVTILPK